MSEADDRYSEDTVPWQIGQHRNHAPSRDGDLVYDGALGWIDPSDTLFSLGLDFEDTESGFIYRDNGPHGRLHGRKVWMPKDRETLEVVRACLQDAEARIPTETGSDST